VNLGFIVGAGAVPCGRYLDRPLSSIAAEALDAAVADAGIAASEVDAVVVANALEGGMTGQECIRGEVMLKNTAFAGRSIINVENACASGASALHVACMAVASGMHQVVAVLGAEKMTHQEKSRAFSALHGALDTTEPLPESAAGRSVFMDLYAAKARRHQDRAGWEAEDAAAVVVKNRRHAALNPLAQYRQTLTAAEVLASRMIVAPLTLPMCAPIGDSAAAVIVCARPPSVADRVVSIRASAVATHRRSASTVAAAADAAYAQAEFGPEDVDVAEVHDAVATAEIEEYEHLGFAAEGEGHLLLRRGTTSLGGSLPVNTSGGLISRGHPVGATGVLQIVELVDQLRGEAGARQVEPRPNRALAQNAGGLIDGEPAVAVVTILERGRYR
jgi:acetyl-CoA acyltransferase